MPIALLMINCVHVISLSVLVHPGAVCFDGLMM